MFTVKQTDGGSVWLKQCADVSIAEDNGFITVVCRDEGGNEIAGITGWVETTLPITNALYVMNEAGATVSMHKFRPSAHSSLRVNGGGVCAGSDQPAEEWRPNRPFIKLEPVEEIAA